jgi:hypothetical protein
MYSKREAETKFLGWHRTGSDIRYYPSKRKLIQTSLPQLYTLSFTIELNFDKDVVYLAHCYPYTYSDCL